MFLFLVFYPKLYGTKVEKQQICGAEVMNLALGIALLITSLSLAATDVHVEITEGTRTVIAPGVHCSINLMCMLYV